MDFTLHIPDHTVSHIFLYCDSDTLAKCHFVSCRFNAEAAAAVKRAVSIISAKYFSRGVFENKYFIRTSNLLLLQNLTQTRIFVVRGIVTYVLNIKNGVWDRCADTMRDRGYFAAIWFRGEIFAIGTYSVIAAGTVEKYNTLANCWTHGPSLPLKLRSACAAVLDDKLYVLGGHDAFTMTYHDTMFIYEEGQKCDKPDNNNIDSNEFNTNQEDSWILCETRLLRPRSRHAAVGFDGKLWIAGGCFEDNSEVTTSVDIFDPITSIWKIGPPLTTRRDFSNLLIVLDSLYAVGGDVKENGEQAIRTIEKFDKDMNCWVTVTAFKDERRGFSTSSHGSKIFIFGGSSEENYDQNTWDAYDVVELQWDSDLLDKYQKMPLIDCWGQAVTVPSGKMTW